jgi:hypothetical protein
MLSDRLAAAVNEDNGRSVRRRCKERLWVIRRTPFHSCYFNIIIIFINQ